MNFLLHCIPNFFNNIASNEWSSFLKSDVESISHFVFNKKYFESQLFLVFLAGCPLSTFRFKKRFMTRGDFISFMLSCSNYPVSHFIQKHEVEVRCLTSVIRIKNNLKKNSEFFCERKRMKQSRHHPNFLERYSKVVKEKKFILL